MNIKIPVLCILIFAATGRGFDTTYTVYDGLLKRHVCNGGVAYASLKSDPAVHNAAESFARLTQKEWDAFKSPERLAFLINLYNFSTIRLILEHYPLKKGIRDIKAPWKTPFVPLLGKSVSLDHIEHGLIRKLFDEPRIHAALVCAAKSCPALLNEAYTGNKLEEQLDRVVRGFLSDSTKNRIDNKKLMLSSIFEWYGNDFKKRFGGVKPFVNKYVNCADCTVSFLPYDWALNDVPACVK